MSLLEKFIGARVTSEQSEDQGYTVVGEESAEIPMPAGAFMMLGVSQSNHQLK